MTARRHLVSLSAVLVSLMLVGCGSGEDSSPGQDPASSADYVQAVEELLGPAGALAAIASDRLSGRPAQASQSAALVAGAEMELKELKELPLTDPGLVAQRRRLVRGFRPVLSRMRIVARDLARNDRDGLETSGPQLFTAIRELPSATSA